MTDSKKKLKFFLKDIVLIQSINLLYFFFYVNNYRFLVSIIYFLGVSLTNYKSFKAIENYYTFYENPTHVIVQIIIAITNLYVSFIHIINLPYLHLLGDIFLLSIHHSYLHYNLLNYSLINCNNYIDFYSILNISNLA